MMGNTMDKSIRFIDSHYNDLFRIPDGGVIQVTYEGREFLTRCKYLDEYHTQVGYTPYHICQYAEILEKGGGSCQPESLITAEEAAWNIVGKGYLAVQTCSDGYDYTIYDTNYHEIDGGVLEMPELTMNEVRDEILIDQGWGCRTMENMNYDLLARKAELAEEKKLSSVRTSALEQLSGLSGISSGKDNGVPRRKEAER